MWYIDCVGTVTNQREGDEMASNWRILGVNDDVTTCECCGKSGLKCTVVLTDGDQEVAYGRDCAAKAVAGKFGRPKTAAKTEQDARNIAAGHKPYVKPSRPYFDAAGRR